MIRRGLPALLFALVMTAGAHAEESPSVSIVSRDGNSIGVIAEGFEVKKSRDLFYRVDSGERVPLPDAEFRISTPKTGVYTLSIVSQRAVKEGEGPRDNLHWEQDLFAVVYSEILADRGVRERLARKYAPIPLFDRTERFYPSPLPYILNEESSDPILAAETVQVRHGKVGWTPMTFAELPEYLAVHGRNNLLLDTPRLRKILKGEPGKPPFTQLQMRNGGPERATIYYSILDRPERQRAYVNYHFLYAYDPKGGDSTDPSKVGHLFDRESITVVVNTTSMEATAVVFGAHLASQTMGLLGPDKSALFKWNGGRVTVPWEAADKVGTHPIAAVALGSHGIYPLPGRYAVFEAKIKLLQEAVGGDRVLLPGHALDLAPADAELIEVVPYRLVDLGLDEATSHSWNRILVFSGNLIDVPGGVNAKFPPFTDRETDPVSYTEEAESWPIDEIPESAREGVKRILEALRPGEP